MLALLLAVTLSSYRGVDRVHDELTDVTDYLVPISQRSRAAGARGGAEAETLTRNGRRRIYS